MGATEIEDLPLGTLDAYLRAGQVSSQRCGIDWTLLGGIGAIESFHGTIGDSVVGPSGRVHPPILGPLLDGGATVAEAAEAARQAEREAQAAAEAEAEAEAAEIAEAEPELPTELWGDPPPPEPTTSRPDGFDPLLWGEPTAADETDGAGGADPENEDAAESDDESQDDDAPIRARGNGFAVIHDSDDGRLDGNHRWDRAVGPMQFLPETWSRFEADGNDDAVFDPQNLYDAAATAGAFLCWLKSHRGADPGSFVLGYNSSDTYVRNVLGAAERLGSVALPVVEDGS